MRSAVGHAQLCMLLFPMLLLAFNETLRHTETFTGGSDLLSISVLPPGCRSWKSLPIMGCRGRRIQRWLARKTTYLHYKSSSNNVPDHRTNRMQWTECLEGGGVTSRLNALQSIGALFYTKMIWYGGLLCYLSKWSICLIPPSLRPLDHIPMQWIQSTDIWAQTPPNVTQNFICFVYFYYHSSVNNSTCFNLKT